LLSPRHQVLGFAFGPFELTLDRYELRRGESSVPLEPRIFEVLSFLIEHRGRVISKDELWRELWGGRSVADGSLARAIQGVRQVLGDAPEQPRWIKTIHGRGYVFLGEAREILRPEPRAVQGAEADAVAASIAVLPFRDLSPGADQRYFCDGIAEEILNELSTIEGLQVAPRAALLRYRGHPVGFREIAQGLQVRYLLEGSVRYHEGTRRITIQLLSAKDGFQIWARQYDRNDRDDRDVFAIQTEVARSVAQALPRELSRDHRPGVLTHNSEAFDRYLRALRWQRRDTRQGFSTALRLYQEAAALDPQFGNAFAGIALCSASLFFLFEDTPEMLARAQAAREHALAVAPGLAWSHHANAIVSWLTGELESAEEAFEATLRLDPAHYEGCIDAGRFEVFRENLEKAQSYFRRAAQLRLDRFDALIHLANCTLALGEEEETQALCRKVTLLAQHHLESAPEDARAWGLGAVAFARLHQGTEARQWLERALVLDPADARLRYNAACTFGILGQESAALRQLVACIRSGFPRWDLAMWDPDLALLHQTPRFRRLLRIWQRRGFTPTRQRRL
jgi:adenylate cyclase